MTAMIQGSMRCALFSLVLAASLLVAACDGGKVARSPEELPPPSHQRPPDPWTVTGQLRLEGPAARQREGTMFLSVDFPGGTLMARRYTLSDEAWVAGGDAMSLQFSLESATHSAVPGRAPSVEEGLVVRAIYSETAYAQDVLPDATLTMPVDPEALRAVGVMRSQDWVQTTGR